MLGKKSSKFAGLILLGIFFIMMGMMITPSFLESHFAPDRVIAANTILDIQMLRGGAISTGVLLILFAFLMHSKSARLNSFFYNVSKFTLSGRSVLFLLVAILAVGFILRIYNLGKKSLWIDEVFSVLASSKANLSSVFYQIGISDFNKPPLHFILLHFWIKIFGNSEFAARSLSVFFGVVSILVLYEIAKTLVGKNVALLSALLFSINQANITLSREARYYSLFVLLALLSVFFFIRILKEPEKSKILNPLFYIIFTSSMLYTHYYGFFILLFENLYFLLFIRRYRVQIKKCMILQFIVLICFLPWLPTMLEQAQLALKGIVPPQLSANPEFSMAYLETLHPPPNLLIVLSSYLSFQGYGWFPYTLYPELIFYAALCVFGIYFSLKRNPLTFESIFFVILWLIIPVLTPFIISQRFNLLFNWRYLIFVSLAYLILISNGIINIGKKYAVLGIFLTWLVIMHSVIGLPSYYAFGQKEQWREVAQYIKENELREDLILVDPGWTVPAFKYYYDASGEIVGVVSSRNMNSNQDYFESIQCKVEKARRIWLILSDTPAKGFYKKKLLEYCQQINVKDYINIQVILFAKNEISDS